MHFMSSTGFFGFSFIGMFGMLLFWGLIIWLIIWLIEQSKLENKPSETPKQILKKRLAKGEISKKKFEELIKKI